MITGIIDALRKDNYYGAGDAVEFAKGSKEYVTTWKGFKNKATRAWLSQKK